MKYKVYVNTTGTVNFSAVIDVEAPDEKAAEKMAKEIVEADDSDVEWEEDNTADPDIEEAEYSAHEHNWEVETKEEDDEQDRATD